MHLSGIIKTPMADHPEKNTALALVRALDEGQATAPSKPEPIQFVLKQEKKNWVRHGTGRGVTDSLVGWVAHYSQKAKGEDPLSTSVWRMTAPSILIITMPKPTMRNPLVIGAICSSRRESARVVAA